MEKKYILILDEILAEVVYVLEKVYKIDRQEISKILLMFINKSNLFFRDQSIISMALSNYAKFKIDFIDSVLLAYSYNKINTIHTFDKKLKKLIENIK